MASPVVASRGGVNEGSASTAHPITMPSGAAAGDLIIVWFAPASASATTSIGAGTGWTLIGPPAAQTGLPLAVVAYKTVVANDLNGTDPLSLSTSASVRASYYTWRITGHDGTVDNAKTSATGSAVNPPSLTPAGGSDDYLWLALAASSLALGSYTAAPSGYSDLQNQVVGGTAARLASAEKSATASTEDPDAFTNSSGPGGWGAWTLAIGPDPVFAQELTPDLLTNSEIIEWPTVAPGAWPLTPALLSDGDTFYAPAAAPGAVALTPALLSDGDTFHAATVTPGGVTIAPELLSDADTFFGPTAAPGAVALTPALLSDGDTFYGPAAAPGAVALTPALLSDGDTFFDPAAAPGSVTLAPALVSDGDTFHAATVNPGGVVLTPVLLSDGDTFFDPAATPGAVTLAPALFGDGDTFHAATVTPGPVTLTAPLAADDDAFHAPALSLLYRLLPPTLGGAAIFYAPRVWPRFAVPGVRVARPGAIRRSARPAARI